MTSCSECNKDFQNEESLLQHKQAKHAAAPIAVPKPKKGKGKLVLAILILAVVVASYFVFAGKGEKPLVDPSKPASELDEMLAFNLQQHTGSLALHIHPVLSIKILGEYFPIPSDVGISSKGMRVIHTHDSTGSLHIESPKPFQFYLKDFFTIWGKPFNSTCILDSCVDEFHSLSVYVNDERASDVNVPLKDKDRILISYDRIGG